MNASSVIAIILGVIGSAGLGGIIKTWLDHQRGKRKQSDDVAMALVTKLESRVDKLEGDLEREQQRCEVMLGVHRHRINNQRTLIYSLLHLFDMPAARRKEALVTVRAELASMEQAEALEKGIVASAPLKTEAAE